MFLGTGLSCSGSAGGSSRLKIERGTSGKTFLSTPEGGPRRALDRVQINQRRRFRHRLHGS